MSQLNNQKDERLLGESRLSRSEKLKEIDSLYRAQIKQIYTESKNKHEKLEYEEKKIVSHFDKNKSYIRKQAPTNAQTMFPIEKQLQNAKSVSTLNIPDSKSESKMFNSCSDSDEKGRASMFLMGESTRTIEILRRQNQTKELKIRDLTNKCENLIQKLKKHLSRTSFEAQMETLKEFTDSKMERLENLFKIKQEEIFFKIKLQVIGLLQEFGATKEELVEFSDISLESNLFSLMVRKLKNKLKDFRSREQENSFELQKDKILNQKQEQRIHFLTETNELLKLSESKLKSKIQDLKVQLNEYLNKLKAREQENQQNQNEVFRLRRQNEELQSLNQKLSTVIRQVKQDQEAEKIIWEGKQKELKTLLSNYFVQKKKVEAFLEEKQGQIEEMIIKHKFLEQDNERISRELVRWKERYEWLERQKSLKLKEADQERNNALFKFEEYKMENNQGILTALRNEIDELLRKVEQYQRGYERAVLELQQERALLHQLQEQGDQRVRKLEKEWQQRVKRLEKIKQEQLYEISQDSQTRISQIREDYEKKERLIAEEMQARLKTLLAQKDKRITQQLIGLESENDHLRREITELNKVIQVKQSLINVMNCKSYIREVSIKSTKMK